ncbi:MAG: YlxR family protein [Proteobacteria bacterium]|nr:YlxR family protein [Pseudomonadota bacterium]
MLLRFVLSPDGEAILDYNSKLPGRGAYLCPERECIESAVKSNGFSRAFKQQVSSPLLDSLLDVVSAKAKAKIDSLVIFAVKAGKAFLGTVSVEGGIRRGRIAHLFCSNELSSQAKDRWRSETRSKGVPLNFFSFTGAIDKLTGGKKTIGIADGNISAEIARELELITKLRPGIQE